MVKTRTYLSGAACVALTYLMYRFFDEIFNTLQFNLNIDKNPLYIRHERSSVNYLQEMAELNQDKVSMDDPRLIKLIRNYGIENPSDDEYNLSKPKLLDPSAGQAAFVDNRMQFKEHGFFVECGALDGELRSNTLMLERLRRWDGLLIEADPDNYRLLKQKHRKAFTINACLSVYNYPVIMRFKQRFNQGKLVENDADLGGKKGTIITVQCFPLYSILLALNVAQIDFFSLDVEGKELEVLQTVPFNKLNIDMMTVEFKHIDLGEEYLKNYVESKGYVSLVKIGHYNNWANDIIFRKMTEPPHRHVLQD